MSANPPIEAIPQQENRADEHVQWFLDSIRDYEHQYGNFWRVGPKSDPIMKEDGRPGFARQGEKARKVQTQARDGPIIARSKATEDNGPIQFARSNFKKPSPTRERTLEPIRQSKPPSVAEQLKPNMRSSGENDEREEEVEKESAQRRLARKIRRRTRAAILNPKPQREAKSTKRKPRNPSLASGDDVSNSDNEINTKTVKERRPPAMQLLERYHARLPASSGRFTLNPGLKGKAFFSRGKQSESVRAPYFEDQKEASTDLPAFLKEAIRFTKRTKAEHQAKDWMWKDYNPNNPSLPEEPQRSRGLVENHSAHRRGDGHTPRISSGHRASSKNDRNKIPSPGVTGSPSWPSIIQSGSKKQGRVEDDQLNRPQGKHRSLDQRGDMTSTRARPTTQQQNDDCYPRPTDRTLYSTGKLPQPPLYEPRLTSDVDRDHRPSYTDRPCKLFLTPSRQSLTPYKHRVSLLPQASTTSSYAKSVSKRDSRGIEIYPRSKPSPLKWTEPRMINNPSHYDLNNYHHPPKTTQYAHQTPSRAAQTPRPQYRAEDGVCLSMHENHPWYSILNTPTREDSDRRLSQVPQGHTPFRAPLKAISNDDIHHQLQLSIPSRFVKPSSAGYNKTFSAENVKELLYPSHRDTAYTTPKQTTMTAPPSTYHQSHRSPFNEQDTSHMVSLGPSSLVLSSPHGLGSVMPVFRSNGMLVDEEAYKRLWDRKRQRL